MADFDKRNLKRWLQKQTGSNLIPAKTVKRPSTGDAELDEAMDKLTLSPDTMGVSRPSGDDGYTFGFTGFQRIPLQYSQIAASSIYGIRTDDDNPPTTYPTYGGISRAHISEVADWPKPETDKLAPLKRKLKSLSTAEPERITKPSPDYVHTLTGWRAWTVASGMLQSLGSHEFWKPKVAERSVCLRAKSRNSFWFSGFMGDAKHDCPGMRCVCGYWTFKTQDLLVQALADYADQVDVIGIVDVWGRVIECENGYRSEYAYPRELWLLKDGLKHLSWSYGVPVRRLGVST